MSTLPPLPPGWSEHTGPDGTPYYFHRVSNTSTYTRPVLPGASSAAPPKPVKDKPKSKRPVPGTEWLRVETVQGNVFWTHTGRKASVWSVPEEIKELVDRLDAEGWEERGEIERVKAEAQELKRKLSEEQEQDEQKHKQNKKARVDDDSDEEKKPLPRPKKLKPEEAAAQALGVDKTTDKVNLSVEEAKALFMTLLQEKQINPLLPWDTSLPQFIHDPRYALLPSQNARKEVFDEYCKEQIRKQKEEKAKNGPAPKLTPEESFTALLERTCTSTRTSYTEWRRTVKKERAFLDFGRSERERENKFRAWLKVLGERKRRDKERAEKDFFDLLRQFDVNGELEWKDAKRTPGLADDPRYDAVGSSSLREELYNTFVKTVQRERAGEDAAPDEETRRKAKQERAERERAAKVRAQQEKVEADLGRARKVVGVEEAEAAFGSLLTDAVRDVTTFDAALPQLQTDPRFAQSAAVLNPHQQKTLFDAHVGRIRERHLKTLHDLFGAHAPRLDDPYPEGRVERSVPVERLRFTPSDVHAEFTRWSRQRLTTARADFETMLRENSFVEFWGRARKLGGEGAVKDKDADEDDVVGEGEEGGGTADLKALARGVGIEEVEKVLKGDKRYIVFDHVPEERERWVREYLERMAAPKLSVHVPEH
ncbi:hypothetical protein EXIGLDRAFT_719060 [Exidia glandulosa HHB12029]|uniref:WW domain-containing protein n=1 Tax=Exidia glandulosa HHB12029 TaxID=1314781 RepID=A0A165HCE2_EXIGL|nr:hypothetical protein EXIGLDRAFT_719060 [Exidia glandulosa HHB12029]